MALAHLQILQEYAMLNDNFRAIGLLTEVEKSIIHPPQKEDFDLWCVDVLYSFFNYRFYF